MKLARILILLLVTGTLACQRDNASVKPKDDLDLLYQRFHGKYKIISSTSSQPLDVNFDGVSSTNLLSEILELNNYGSFLELQVKYPDRAVFLFTQFWPEQYITIYSGPNSAWNGRDTLSYNPSYLVNYANQANPYRFSFTDDLSQILVVGNEQADQIRWVKPESVLVEPKDQLRMINKRRIYTREGVKEVTITTLYERFTMTT